MFTVNILKIFIASLVVIFSDAMIQWKELITSNHFRYIEKAALYNWFGYLDIRSTYSSDFHEHPSYGMNFAVIPTKFATIDVTETFPVSRFMSVLRIYYASEGDLDFIWNLLDNKTLAVLSFENEKSVLDLAVGRLQQLWDMFCQGDTSDPNDKRYVVEVLIATKILQELLSATNSTLIPQLSDVEESTRICDDRCYKLYTNISESLTDTLLLDLMTMFPKDTDIDSTSIRTEILYLVNVYVHESLVPFVNRIVGSANNTVAHATPVALYSKNSSFTVDSKVHESKLVIIERDYKQRNLSNMLIVDTTSNASSSTTNAFPLVNISNSFRIFFSKNRNETDENLAKNINGYGAFSSVELECLTYTSTDHDATTNRHCFAIMTTLRRYNSVVVSTFALAPRWLVDKNKIQRHYDKPLTYFLSQSHSPDEAIDHAIAYEKSLGRFNKQICTASIRRSHALSLGLGSGELHMFLLQHFPCLAVDSVEISEDLFHVSKNVMGELTYGVCKAERWNKTSQELELISLNSSSSSSVSRSATMSGKDVHSDSGIREAVTDDDECRSKVYIADAWDYIQYRNQQNKFIIDNTDTTSTTEGVVLYDVIVFDVFDTKAVAWSGEISQGESNSFVDKAASSESLLSVRNLLSVDGIAIFHLHKDRHFAYYYERIKDVFGPDQVVLFNVVSNDHIVVAGKELFRIQSYLDTANDTCMLNETTDTNSNTDSNSSTNTCKEQVMETEARKAIHPCQQPLQYAENIIQLGEVYQFKNRVTLTSKYSLNCQDKTEYFIA